MIQKKDLDIVNTIGNKINTIFESRKKPTGHNQIMEQNLNASLHNDVQNLNQLIHTILPKTEGSFKFLLHVQRIQWQPDPTILGLFFIPTKNNLAYFLGWLQGSQSITQDSKHTSSRIKNYANHTGPYHFAIVNPNDDCVKTYKTSTLVQAHFQAIMNGQLPLDFPQINTTSPSQLFETGLQNAQNLKHNQFEWNLVPDLIDTIINDPRTKMLLDQNFSSSTLKNLVDCTWNPQLESRLLTIKKGLKSIGKPTTQTEYLIKEENNNLFIAKGWNIPSALLYRKIHILLTAQPRQNITTIHEIKPAQPPKPKTLC